MLDRTNLYCLRKFNALVHAPVSPGSAEREYNGQLMLSGPDTAIEIRGTEIRGYVNGVPRHPSGKLADMIDNYRASLTRGAESLRQKHTDTVILAGKWHHVEFDDEPRFEAYVVHLVSEDGLIQSAFYQSEIFDWDYPGMCDGGGFGSTLTGDQTKDVETLRRLAEYEVNFDENQCVSSSGRPYVDGVFWYPAEESDLPIVCVPGRRRGFDR